MMNEYEADMLMSISLVCLVTYRARWNYTNIQEPIQYIENEEGADEFSHMKLKH